MKIKRKLIEQAIEAMDAAFWAEKDDAWKSGYMLPAGHTVSIKLAIALDHLREAVGDHFNDA